MGTNSFWNLLYIMIRDKKLSCYRRRWAAGESREEKSAGEENSPSKRNIHVPKEVGK
jgi:hypothetical protein